MRWLIPLLLLAFVVRTYHLTYPLGDLHSWRQSDTAAVARSLYSYGPALWLPVCQTELRHIGIQGAECRIPLLNPQIDSFVTIDGKATWMDGRPHTNDTRNHFAEFPIYQAFVAQTALIFDGLPWLRSGLVDLSNLVDLAMILLDPPPNVDRWKEIKYQSNITYGAQIDQIVFAGRLVSILASLMSMVFLSLLVGRYFKTRVALVAASVFGLLPYTVFWSRTVLPDTMMLMFALGGLYFAHLACQSKRNWVRVVAGLLTVVCLGVALLMKVFVLFLLLPILYLLLSTYGLQAYRNWRIWMSLVVMVLPFLFWRWWIQSDILRLPGIPSSSWLFNGSGVRLKPAWWYWLFQTRLDHYMFNFPGIGLLMIGIFFFKEIVAKFKLAGAVVSEKKQLPIQYFWLCTLISCLAYLVVFATGNVQHEYYQLPLVPFISVFVALGFWWIWEWRAGLSGIVQRIVLIALSGLMFLFGAHQIQGWYGQRMPSYVYAGMRADAVLPAEAVVVADFGGDTTMLYYANRPGWSIVEFSFEELIRKGATHYVSAFRSDGVNELAKTYRVVEETPEYVILDLSL